MTPHETAMRLIRQRGTTVSDPAFITAYLAAELDRDPDAFLTPLQRRMRYITDGFKGLNLALAALAGRAIRAGAAMERASAAMEQRSAAWDLPTVATYSEAGR